MFEDTTFVMVSKRWLFFTVLNTNDRLTVVSNRVFKLYYRFDTNRQSIQLVSM